MAQVTPPKAMALAAALAALLAATTPAWAQDAALDAQARARMGQGDARGALQLMRQHVAAQPGDADARLDLVRYLTWNGDFAAAQAALLADPAVADSAEGRELHASLLAWAGRIEQARAVNAPLLEAGPADLMPNYTQAIALRQSARPRLALPYVAAVE
jgi:thioredoxin-like negative regulator of GroEL